MTRDRAKEPTTDAEIEAYTVGAPTRVDGPVYLAPPNPEWPSQYEHQRKRIAADLGDALVLLEHVGSTSIAGLAAKPILDIVLTVVDSADEASYVPALERCGYSLAIREPDWYEHRVLKRAEPKVNLHVFSDGCVEIERMVGFRDWLRTHPEDLQLYGSEKQKLAAQDWKFIQNYADAKSTVVRDIMTRAGLPDATL